MVKHYYRIASQTVINFKHLKHILLINNNHSFLLVDVNMKYCRREQKIQFNLYCKKLVSPIYGGRVAQW